jgi:hypothetical protein
MALHDDEADKRWIGRWTGGDWTIGLFSGLTGEISKDVSSRSFSSSMSIPE